MRTVKRALITAFVAMLALCVMAVPAHAEDYSFKLRIFGGNYGTYSVSEVDGLAEGDTYQLDVNDVTLNEPDGKYYARGFRRAGEDELLENGATNPTITITEDTDVVVVYGVRGEMVSYTVRFIVQGTNQVLGTATFEGKVGDKPVVAYEYFSGYRPLYSGVSGTLTEGENTWDLPYEVVETPTTTTTVVEETTTTTTGGAAAGGAAAGGAAAAAAPAAEGAAATPEAAAPAATPANPEAPATEEILDVDQTPLAGPDAGGNGTQGTGDNGTGDNGNGTGTNGTGSNTEPIGGENTPLSGAAAAVGNNALVIGGVALASLIAFLLLRRRASDTDGEE